MATNPRGTHRVREFCSDMVADGTLFVGLQLSVRQKGEETCVVCGVGGLGQGLRADSRLNIYCAGKPLSGLALMAAAIEHGVSLSEPIGDVLGERLAGFPEHVGTYSARDLLIHNTTLVLPKGPHILALSEAREIEACAANAWHIDRGIGYSDVTAWVLLAWWVECVTGCSTADVIRACLVERIGLDHTSFGVPDDQIEVVLPDVDVNVSVRGLDKVPMLSERSRRRLRRCEPSFGGMSTASDLAAFYNWCLRPRRPNGSGDPLAEQLLDRARHDCRERLHDGGLDIECSFGHGLMLGLGDFGFGRRVSDSAYGHTGFMGVAFGFADPEADLAVGCIVIGITDGESSAEYLRPTLVDLVYDECVC